MLLKKNIQNLSSKINSNIDKALFKAFKNNSFPILRLYSWENCITFGAGQNIDDIEEAVKKVTVGLEKKERVISDKDKKLTGLS